MTKAKTLVYSSVLLANFALAEQALKTDNVVISATGFEQDADNNLRNVIVINGKDLQDKGYTNLTDALSRVPGVSFVNFGLGQNIDMRGQGDKANIAVKVMVDGRAINVLDDAHGVTPLDNINLENVERIEIIPGGGAVLYGNGTRGGAINIITKGKPSESSASFSIRENVFDSGNNGTNANLQFSSKFSEKMAMSFNVNGFNKKGYQDGDKDKGFYVNSKFFYDINDFSYLNFGFDYFRDIKRGHRLSYESTG